MANPFTSGQRQQANSATAPRNSVNDPKAKPKLTHNTFNRSYDHYCTQRYGDLHPFYIEDSVSGDNNPLYSKHQLKTYTLQSPMMTGLAMRKGYFAVPYKAMIPFNFEKVFINPKKGDDVLDNVGTVIPQFSSSFFPISTFVAPVDGAFDELTLRVKFILYLEMFFSSGSLLHALGYKLNRCFRITTTTGSVPFFNSSFKSFDGFFDIFFDSLFRDGISVEFPSLGVTYSTYDVLGVSKVSYHRMIELLRDYPDFKIIDNDGQSDGFSQVVLDLFAEVETVFTSNVSIQVPSRPFDFSRLLAYQISSIVFFSNDDIDNVYTANLFRQNCSSLLIPYSGRAVFSYNGVTCDFDILSGRYLSIALNGFCGYAPFVVSANINTQLDSVYCYISEIFQFRKSLRFSDYFLGARMSPLSVGDINAPVVSNNVSAIDMTRSISIQRFTNFVNKIPSTIAGYLKEMFGVESAVDLTEPSYLGVTMANVGGFEVENTSSENQGKLVTNLATCGGDFAFEVQISDPCVIIGMSWFEQPRIYADIIERQMLHTDRFDKFQPMLQYTGDQDIKQCEFFARNPYSEPYAYTLRNMEYKQRVHQATGGFVENLPSWANVRGEQDYENESDDNVTINSDLIRAKNYEFDKYYSSLEGLSLGNYFHFIVKYMNENKVTRPMAVAPEILG